MEVKIGIADSNRELVFTTGHNSDEVHARVTAALSAEVPSVLELEDEKGRRYLVSTAKIAYVELGKGDKRPVGFLSN